MKKKVKDIFNLFKKRIKRIYISCAKRLWIASSFFKKICFQFGELLRPAISFLKKIFIKLGEWLKPVISFSKKVFITFGEWLRPFISCLEKNPIRFIKHLRPDLFFINLILSLYITTIAILHNLTSPFPNIKIIIVSGSLLLCVTYIIINLFILECDIKISRNVERNILSGKTVFVFLFVSIIVYAVYIINFLANYPGGISPDSIEQWNQVKSGTFNNWHPAIHSMLIWLITRVIDNYAYVIRFQILCFGLMSGYLAATLVSWGIKFRWIVVFLFILISPVTTYGIILFAWKDNALTICLLCLTAYMINIVLSDGIWLRKWYNIVSFAIVFALASLVRHNGIFFTAPLLIFIFMFIKKAKLYTLLTIAASILVIYGITHGLYQKVNVEIPKEQTYVEAVGLPMTILGGVLVKKPEALDDETKTFLNNIASEQLWRRNFRHGSFNSVKFLYPNHKEAIMGIPPRRLLNMTLQAIKNAPEESLLEVVALTRLVWSPFEWQYNIPVWFNESARGIVYTREEINAMQPIKDKYMERNNILQKAIELITPHHLLTSIGLHMLLLLIAGVYSINRNLGYKAFFLFLPSAAYNFGTMLLLCGQDWRFFHFNTVITLPLIIALLAKKNTAFNTS
jgi:hypothetical protein